MRTQVIGILNVTPDSFSDGGKYLDPADAKEAACRMLDEGADLIDIGAVSTRPLAPAVSVEEELRRLHPALLMICDAVGPAKLSVDAGSEQAIDLALSFGIRTLNLCGGFGDGSIARKIANAGARAIVYPSHDSCREESAVEGRLRFFISQDDMANAVGLPVTSLLLSPGMGFGTDAEGDVAMLREFGQFVSFGHPLVIGASRKKHLAVLMAEPTRTPPDQRLHAGLAAAATAVLRGATYVRAHDVLAAKRFFTVFDKLRDS